MHTWSRQTGPTTTDSQPATMTTADSGDAFKEVQARHRKSPQILKDEVIDFRLSALDYRVTPTTGISPSSNATAAAPPQVFGLSSHPGFAFAPACLSPDSQERLAYLALSRYCERPHRTNIDLVPIKSGEEDDGRSIWHMWKTEHGFDDDRINKRQRIEEANACTSTTKAKPYRSPKKLSWATMGYHYDWTKRTYKEEAKSPMPPEIQHLAAELLERMFPNAGSFKAEAAIVNYYNLKQQMGGHRDDLEFDFTKPVVSISLGLPAIFLLGGTTRNEAPLPVLVRPGDVMLLAGKSRLAYHGMAKVIPNLDEDLPSVAYCDMSLPSESSIVIPDTERAAVASFLSSHRININIRQVLPDGIEVISEGMKPPTEEPSKI